MLLNVGILLVLDSVDKNKEDWLSRSFLVPQGKKGKDIIVFLPQHLTKICSITII